MDDSQHDDKTTCTGREAVGEAEKRGQPSCTGGKPHDQLDLVAPPILFPTPARSSSPAARSHSAGCGLAQGVIVVARVHKALPVHSAVHLVDVLVMAQTSIG